MAPLGPAPGPVPRRFAVRRACARTPHTRPHGLPRHADPGRTAHRRDNPKVCRSTLDVRAWSYRSQLPAQEHARAMQLPFRRSAGDVEQCRNLAMLIALDVVEDEDLAGAGRQLLDGL